MANKKRLRFLVIVLIIAGICVGGFAAYNHGRPLQIPVKERLFNGVDYARQVQFSPRPMIIHVITIDTRKEGIRFLVTPPDEKGSEYPLRARITSQFLQETGVQIAINGDRFSPWWSRSPADYYPHAGDPVSPPGDTASRGKVYWTSNTPVPTLYISSRNQLSFVEPGKVFNAISGGGMLVKDGAPVNIP